MRPKRWRRVAAAWWASVVLKSGGEVARGVAGGDGAEVLAEDVGGEVGVAGADEEVVGGLGVEEDFGVAEEADGADVEAVLGEDVADEGAEVG